MRRISYPRPKIKTPPKGGKYIKRIIKAEKSIKKLLKKDLVNTLNNVGFTGNIELFYHANDGWYLHCNECSQDWIGQNIGDCIRRLKLGEFNHFIKR